MTADPLRPPERPGSVPGASASGGFREPRRSHLTAFREVLASAGRHDLSGRSAEAAFFAALALLPAVLTLVAVLRVERPAFAGDAAPRVSADLARLLRIVLTDRGGVAAQSADSLLRTPGRSLLGVGTMVAVFVLARCMRSVQRGLAAIAGAPARSVRREWVRAVLLAALVLIVGSVLLAGFTLGPLLGHSGQVAGEHHDGGLHAVWGWARWPLSAAVILALAVLLLAQETPRTQHRWRAALSGAGVTVLGWAAATGLLPIYVALSAQVSPTLGSLGGGLIVLAWLYLLMLSLFLGAELNATRRGAGAEDAQVRRSAHRWGRAVVPSPRREGV